MLKRLWGARKWLFRTTWKSCKWLFLWTLPLTILPIICGIVNGAYFAYWNYGVINKTADAFLYDVKAVADDWGIPGAMSFREYRDTHNDLHVLRLNANDWVSKLGFILPREYGDWEHNEDTPINNYASLNTLMLDTRPSCYTKPPREQWVFISNLAWPSINPWDDAFNVAVQAAYVNPALNQTRLFYTSCTDTGGFLCGVWGVTAPAVLHFSIADVPAQPEDITPGLKYSASLLDLRPVTVRVVEFPLDGAYTGLSSDVFPGRREQVLSIMLGDRLYEQFEPWDEVEQTFRRYGDYIDRLWDRKGTWMNRLQKADDWMADHVTKPLGLKETLDFVGGSCFLVTMAVNSLVLSVWQWAKLILLDFLGQPRRGDWILGQKAWNLWDDILGSPSEGFLEVMRKKMAQVNLEKVWPEGKVVTDSTSGVTSSSELNPTRSYSPGSPFNPLSTSA